MKEKIVWSPLLVEFYPKYCQRHPWTVLALGFLTPLYIYGFIMSIVLGVKTLADPSAGGFFRTMYVQFAIGAIIFSPIWPVSVFNATRLVLEDQRALESVDE